MVSQIPKVTVAPSDGGWLAECNRPECGFIFWHRLRHVTDEAAVTHQQADVRKAAS